MLSSETRILQERPHVRRASLRETRRLISGDWAVSVIIADPSSHGGGPESEGMVVTIMRPAESALPRVYRGEVILFRNILVRSYLGGMISS